MPSCEIRLECITRIASFGNSVTFFTFAAEMIGIKIVLLLAVAVQWMESAHLSPSTLKCSTLSDKNSSPDTMLFAVSTNPQGAAGIYTL